MNKFLNFFIVWIIGVLLLPFLIVKAMWFTRHERRVLFDPGSRVVRCDGGAKG